jgi:cyclophilin family peptidyl-prolyl cis-trans isomerase
MKTLFAATLAALSLSASLAAAQTQVKLDTSMGAIVLKLEDARAPQTVRNFVEYVRSGHYDGTVFHRVIDGFMIQGGGFTPDMQQKPTRAPIRNEADNGLKNLNYTIAMARTNDPHSATAQFFINVKDNAFLDHRGQTAQGWGYAVFGQVVDGREVVDRIRKVPTGQRGPFGDVPREPVIIKKAEVIE